MKVFQAIASCPECGRLIARSPWSKSRKKLEAQVKRQTSGYTMAYPLTCKYCKLPAEILIATGEKE